MPQFKSISDLHDSLLLLLATSQLLFPRSVEGHEATHLSKARSLPSALEREVISLALPLTHSGVRHSPLAIHYHGLGLATERVKGSWTCVCRSMLPRAVGKCCGAAAS